MLSPGTNNAFSNVTGVPAANDVTAALTTHPYIARLFGGQPNDVFGILGFGANAASGVTGTQTYDMQATIAIDLAKLKLASGDLFVGLLDTESSGNGFDSLDLKFQDQLVGTMLDITFDLGLTASTAGDGFGLSLMLFDPPGAGLAGLPFDLSFTSLLDAQNYFANNHFFDLGPIPDLVTLQPAPTGVPEPGTLSVFGVGLLSLLGLAARRRRSSLRAAHGRAPVRVAQQP